jgi:pimeloyl-ACP methyl ester carboxylesterase
MPTTMQATIAGTSLAYETAGDGRALLFLHAFPLGLEMWDAQASALKSRYRVVRFDCRGFGETPPGDSLLTMERIADDGVALLDHLGISRAVVCGCSMGGYAAFAMVRRHPDRIAALVLANTRANADTAEARTNRSVLAERVLKEGAAAAVESFLPRLVGATTKEERPALVERLRSIMMGNPARGIANALIGLGARADSTPALREIRVPTLVLAGAEDVLTPPSDAELIHKGIAGSTLVTIPKAGHLACLENPAGFNAAIGDFLTRLG